MTIDYGILDYTIPVFYGSLWYLGLYYTRIMTVDYGIWELYYTHIMTVDYGIWDYTIPVLYGRLWYLGLYYTRIIR